MKASGRLGAIAVVMLVVLGVEPAMAGSFGRGAAGHRAAGHRAAGARAIGHRGIVVEPSPFSAFPQPVDPWRIWGIVNQRHLFIHRSPVFRNPAFIGSFGSGAFVPSIVGVPSFADYGPSNVYIPSDSYASGAYAPTAPPVAAPPPLPTVVEYATGRFELRGDGTTVPYQWVWIPKAPPPPPEPPAPPVASQPPAPSATAPEVRPEPGEAFKWTDDQGVTHWTNKPNKIPARYRSQAQPVS